MRGRLTEVARKWALAAVFASCFGMFIASLAYTNHAVTDSQRKLCDLVATLDSAYRANPPQTATGRLVAAKTHELYLRLDCQS